jgi:hypothetical protein
MEHKNLIFKDVEVIKISQIIYSNSKVRGDMPMVLIDIIKTVL